MRCSRAVGAGIATDRVVTGRKFSNLLILTLFPDLLGQEGDEPVRKTRRIWPGFGKRFIQVVDTSYRADTFSFANLSWLQKAFSSACDRSFFAAEISEKRAEPNSSMPKGGIYEKPVYYTANGRSTEIFKPGPAYVRTVNHGLPEPEGLLRLQAAKLGKFLDDQGEWLRSSSFRSGPFYPCEATSKLEIPPI